MPYIITYEPVEHEADTGWQFTPVVNSTEVYTVTDTEEKVLYTYYNYNTNSWTTWQDDEGVKWAIGDNTISKGG